MTAFVCPGPVCTERYRRLLEEDYDHLSHNRAALQDLFRFAPGPMGINSYLFHGSSGAGSSGAGVPPQKVNDLGLTDSQVLAGSSSPSSWFSAVINPASKTISVTINVNFLTTKPLAGEQAFPSQEMTDDQKAKLIGLAQKGVSRFWSRTIDLNGDAYAVNVSLSNNIDGMDIWLKINESKKYTRSFNSKGTNSPFSTLGSVIYYQLEYFGQNATLADQDFQVTAAHEIGHAILTLVGGREFSWGHKGTSGTFGEDNGNMLPVPSNGKMDLMMYYKATVQQKYIGSQASESDIKNLIYISRRPRSNP
jgi:hypothetical protein